MKKFIIPNKREDAIKFFRKNLDDIYTLKKKTIKTSDPITTDGNVLFGNVGKMLNTDKLNVNLMDVGKAKVTFIANTYLWMDSHSDVHDIGVFSNSIKEQKGKLFHLHDHKFELDARVGNVENVKEEYIDWSDLGIEKNGQTQILKIKSNILKRYNESIFQDYIEKKINQHSVSMRYIKLAFAVDDIDNEKGYKLYSEYIEKIGNKEKAEKQGYFWVIREAALREFSCVLLGSNELTPTLNVKRENEKEIAIKKFLNII